MSPMSPACAFTYAGSVRRLRRAGRHDGCPNHRAHRRTSAVVCHSSRGRRVLARDRVALPHPSRRVLLLQDRFVAIPGTYVSIGRSGRKGNREGGLVTVGNLALRAGSRRSCRVLLGPNRAILEGGADCCVDRRPRGLCVIPRRVLAGTHGCDGMRRVSRDQRRMTGHDLFLRPVTPASPTASARA